MTTGKRAGEIPPIWPAEIEQKTLDLSLVEELFDGVPNLVFFIKDVEGRYLSVNQTLVRRCGFECKDEVLGKTTVDLFPAPLGDRFLKQDLQVIRTGTAIIEHLELHLYPDRSEGWCLTDKQPIRDGGGAVVGVAGISRDLQMREVAGLDLSGLAKSVAYIRQRYAEDLRVEDLAAMAKLSEYQLNRRIRTIFGITIGQLLVKTRIDAAAHLLRTTTRPVADIAVACGYCDQSAFSRQFKASVGLTPRQYRKYSRSSS